MIQIFDPYGLQKSKTELELAQQQGIQSAARFPYELKQLQANIGQTQFQTSRGQQLLPYEVGMAESQYQDYLAGSAQREAERQYAEAIAKSRTSFIPQMEAIRGGIASKMTSNMGKQSGLSQAASSMVPSYGGSIPQSSNWMQSYSIPQFPSYGTSQRPATSSFFTTGKV